MQCDDCNQIYRADDEKQPCPTCGGKGTVLVDITNELYRNRAEKRAAKKARLPTAKYFPCPKCQSAK